jgi:DnaJ like chaperone protein
MFVEIQLRFALAGSDLGANARSRITRAAGLLGIAPLQLQRIEAALRGGPGPGAGNSAQDHAARTAAAYRTLETDPSVSNEELTRTYRRLLSRHHPDKLKANGLPDSMLEHAKQRTQAIKEAYELLRTQRGMG